MKKINAFIIGGVLASLCMFACNDDDENAENNERDNQTTVTTSLKGSFFNHSECLNNDTTRSFVPNLFEFAAKYKFDLEKKSGTITHLSSLHNCCPDTLFSNVIIKGDSILITETETNGKCKCKCTYDMTSQFTGVEKKVYHVRMVNEENKFYDFDIDLTQQTEGTWTKDVELKGNFLSISDCKGDTYNTTFENDGVNSIFNEFNVNYKFDLETGSGIITHVNAIYNCCPGEIYTTIEIDGDNITIKEVNKPDEVTCDCVCPYDINTQLEGVQKKVYHVKMESVQGSISFDLDLSKETEGTFSGTYE